MTGERVDAIVMAGGRIHAAYARAAGTTLKALVTVRGVPVVRRVSEALREAATVDRICVVGPTAVRDASEGTAGWCHEAASAVANVLAGLDYLAPSEGRRVLVCGCDVPFLKAASADDFILRSPDAEVTMPVVSRESWSAAFPGCARIFVRLATGSVTAGSQFLIRTSAFRGHQAVARMLFDRRKSQVGMARTLGMGIAWRLLRGTLRIEDVEERLSRATGIRCRAVLDCGADLAYDLDTAADLADAAARAVAPAA